MSMKKTLNTSALVTADSPKGQRATETFRAQYTKAGLDNESAQILNENAGFARYLADGIRSFSTKVPSYSVAQSILGKDFITPEEVSKARLGIVYTGEQTRTLARSLPSKDMLKWCKKNGYAMMPAPPTATSLIDVREIRLAHFYSNTGGWYANQKFAHKDKTSFGWLAIKKTPVANSTNKDWGDQNKLLFVLELVPNVAEMSWLITTYFEVRRIRLFESIYVRTSSLVSDGGRVFIGKFSSEGLGVYGYWDHNGSADIGLSACMKIEQ